MKKLLLTTAIVLTLGSVGISQIPTNSLLVHYDFNTNTNDISSNEHHAVADNVTYVVAPYSCSDKAVQIAPSSTINYDYTTHKTDFETQSYSCVVRAKINSMPNTYANFLELGDPSTVSSYFRLFKSGLTDYNLQGGFYDAVTGTSANIQMMNPVALTTLTNGSYHYFGIISDFNTSNNLRTIKLYLDGSLVFTQYYPNSQMNYPANYSVMSIGGRSGMQTMNLNGNIDDFLLYNRALSDSEMITIMTPPPSTNINIPNANFKTYLVGNSTINANGDGEIQCGEAAAFTGTINCAYLSISDLTGIEHFTSLTGLVCNNNQLTSLNLSSNTALTTLICNDNQLTSLTLSGTALTAIDCKGNQLTALDVTSNTALTSLACHYNQLTSLDLSNNTALTSLACRNNLLANLNMKNGNNVNLTLLWAQNNANLTCIQVDNEAYSTTNWTGVNFTKPASANFNENCAAFIASPTTLSVTSNNNPLSISLVWIDNSTNEDGYKVERSTNGINFTEIADIQENSIAYIDNNVSEHTTYHYRVYAYNTDGNSDFSNIAQITTGVNCNVQITSQVGTGHCPDVDINVSNATFPVTFSLSWPGGSPVTTTVNSSPHTYTTMCTSSYTLTVTDVNGCSETITFIVGNADINENILNTFSIHPNPAGSFVTLENIPVESKITLFDITGKIVHTMAVTETSSQIETNTFMNGVYHIQISNPVFGAVTKKLVVSK